MVKSLRTCQNILVWCVIVPKRIMSTVLSTDKEGNSGNGNDEGFDTISAASLLHAWATSQPNSAANSRAGSRVGSRAASPAAENAGKAMKAVKANSRSSMDLDFILGNACGLRFHSTVKFTHSFFL